MPSLCFVIVLLLSFTLAISVKTVRLLVFKLFNLMPRSRTFHNVALRSAFFSLVAGILLLPSWLDAALGHRFVIVDRSDRSEVTVTSELSVQAFRVGGFPVVASAKVNPYALKEAVHIIDMLLARRPDVRVAMIKSGARLKAAYDGAMKAGLWRGAYASTNHHEYWAEGVQSWFDNNRENDAQHNHVNTRDELLAYDGKLAALCREVFGDTGLKYTKPQTRLVGHLADYDPNKAPKFIRPLRLEKARGEIKKHQRKRFEEATVKKEHDKLLMAGWTVRIHPVLFEDAQSLEKALQLLRAQLDEIVHVVPAKAVAELQKVPLWVNPEHPKTLPRAEYHPGADWLRDNGRDPVMAKAVEFTNVRIFEEEVRRMPNFALHELAHAYHDRVLGFENALIEAAFQKAKATGKYDKVQRQDREGRKRLDKAYAMTNAKEYFAELTEAFFSRNDFFPFNREDLKQHDPEAERLLEQLWGVNSKR